MPTPAPAFLRLPYPPYLRRILLRTLLMWVLVKLFIITVLLFSDPTLEPIASLVIPTFGIPALFVWIDRLAARERILPGNLGTSEFWLSGASFGAALGFDLLSVLLYQGLAS